MLEIYNAAIKLTRTRSDLFPLLSHAARISTPAIRLAQSDPLGWRAKVKAVAAFNNRPTTTYWSR